MISEADYCITINGAVVRGSQRFEVVNPATEEVLATPPVLGE